MTIDMNDKNSSKYSMELKIYRRIMFVLNTLVHMAVAILTFIIIKFVFNDVKTDKLIKLHIFFSVVGYQFLLIEGIIAFIPSNSWSFGLRIQQRRLVHMIVQILGAIFVVVGFILAVVAKSQTKRPHFKSTHGILGLVGFIFTLICLFNGVIAYYVQRWRETMRPTVVKFIHTISGCVVVIMGMITLCYGLKKGYDIEHISDKEVSVAITLTVLSVAFALFNPVLSIRGYLDNMRSTEL